MKHKPILAMTLLSLLAIPAIAQNPFQKAPAAKPPTATLPPVLTEVQKLKLENIQLKFSVIQSQQQQLQTEYQALVQQLLAEHPGYRWDAQTQSLVAVPTPAAGKK